MLHSPGTGLPSLPALDRPGTQPTASRQHNYLAVAGLIMAVVFWPVGLVLSALGFRRTWVGDAPGRGLAIAGLVISTVAIVPTAISAVSLVGQLRVSQAMASISQITPGPVPSGDFGTPTSQQWSAVLRNPDSHAGEQWAFYAEVKRIDPGNEVFAARATFWQPASSAELEDQPMVLVTAPSTMVGQLNEGDLVVVRGQTEPSWTYADDGELVDALVVTAGSVETGDYRDLAADVVLGDSARDQAYSQHSTTIPLTITNSGGERFGYSGTVQAVSPDGATVYEQSPFTIRLRAGDQDTQTVTLRTDLPADAVIQIVEVARTTW